MWRRCVRARVYAHACVSQLLGSCGRHSRYLRQSGKTGGVLVPIAAVRSCPPCVVAVIVQVARTAFALFITGVEMSGLLLSPPRAQTV